MEFREGMLGVVVIALALTGSLFVSYVSGIEGEEYEVTKYEYLADVSGMFDYDKSPQYIEFDPSSNYTGYYSTDTGEYFPIENVNFVENVNESVDPPIPRANNYRINLEPIVVNENTIADLTDLTTPTYETGHYMVRYVYSDTNVGNIGWNYPSYPMSLSNLLTAMGFSSDTVSTIYISVGNSVNWNDIPSEVGYTEYLDLDTALFIPTSWFKTIGTNEWTYIVNPNFDLETVSEFYPTSPLHHPIQSLKIDYTKNTVNLYYDLNWENIAATSLMTSSVMVCFGSDQGQDTSDLNLSNSFVYSAYLEQRKQYLDPNYGVSMEDE